MSVTDYLERARECAALADKAKETHKPKILAIADAWLKLADEAALEAKQESTPDGKLPGRLFRLGSVGGWGIRHLARHVASVSALPRHTILESTHGPALDSRDQA